MAEKNEQLNLMLGRFNRWLDRYGRLIILVLLASLLLIPFLDLNSYIINILVKVVIYVIMALGLNILVGYTGLVSLGQAGFVAVGAYTSTILMIRFGLNFFVAALAAVVVAVFIGLIMGLPTLRLTGTYLSIVTLGFGEIIRTIIIVWDPVTRGPLGIRNIPVPSVFGFQLTMFNGGLYILSVLVMLLVMLFLFRLEKFRAGRALRAIKQDETASIMMGIDTTYYKVLAFVLSAVICALAGSIYATQLGYIDQNTFTFDMSIMILSIVILGGMGTIRGMLVGSLILVWLPELSRDLMDYRFVLYGVILVLMMRFRPQGLLGWRSGKPYYLSENVRTLAGLTTPDELEEGMTDGK